VAHVSQMEETHPPSILLYRGFLNKQGPPRGRSLQLAYDYESRTTLGAAWDLLFQQPLHSNSYEPHGIVER